MKISFSIRLAFFTIIRFGILNFGHCNLFVFWDLLFGISIAQLLHEWIRISFATKYTNFTTKELKRNELEFLQIHHYQITLSFPPSMGIWAPVVLAKAGPTMAQTRAATSFDVTSVFKQLLVLYSSTVHP